jgi:hypothetical protein
MKFARQKVSKCYTEVTRTAALLLITSHIFDPFWKFQPFRKRDMGMDINPEDEPSDTT